MQTRGLFLTFKDIADFKARLRNHLDTLLADFQALLIPAGRALAYGLFKNFVKPTYDALQGLKVDLPDYKLPNEGSEMSLSFSSFRIRIAKPASWTDATDAAVSELRRNRLAEINIKTPGMRRAFRIYVPLETKQALDNVMRDDLERAKKGEPLQTTVHLERLDVVDFPTPMIALREFVSYVEQSILKGKTDGSSASGYWQRQKMVQYNEFFECLDARISEEGLEGPSIEYFNYKKGADFKLPD